MNRVNEISFNSSLLREMRAIAFVTRLIDEGRIYDRSLKRINVHAIAADAVMQKLSVMSKLNADWEFLTHLRDDGREFASSWLDENFARIGLEVDDRRAWALFMNSALGECCSVTSCSLQCVSHRRQVINSFHARL